MKIEDWGFYLQSPIANRQSPISNLQSPISLYNTANNSATPGPKIGYNWLNLNGA
ncbi:MAG: hypothetical protein KKD28_08445 [Chloroflexi bacterium]|nr:hypothetical protein [Chloroflexota bacterium]MBU1661489.1 hypothetical protein [Chloroflexota bacterium]